MVSMFGRGFDSRQLHDQAENNHPRQGVCFLKGLPLKACFHKVALLKNNYHAQRGGCFLFAGLELRDHRVNVVSEVPPPVEKMRGGEGVKGSKLKSKAASWLFSVCWTGTKGSLDKCSE